MAEYTKVDPSTINIDITDEMVENTYKAKRLRQGVMKARCTRAENVIAGTGSYMGKLVFNPVDENDTVKGPAVSTNFVYPFANGDHTKEDGSQHEAPDTAKRCQRYLLSADPDLPRLARWRPETKDFETPDGDVLDGEDGRLYNLGVRKQYTEELKARLMDADRVLGGYVNTRVVWNDKNYPDIATFYAEPPSDAELIVDNFGVKC